MLSETVIIHTRTCAPQQTKTHSHYRPLPYGAVRRLWIQGEKGSRRTACLAGGRPGTGLQGERGTMKRKHTEVRVPTSNICLAPNFFSVMRKVGQFIAAETFDHSLDSLGLGFIRAWG